MNISYDKNDNPAQDSFSDRWAALTLSSLVKKATQLSLTLPEGEATELADSLGQRVEEGHEWLLEGSTPPVTKLIELVKASHFLEEYSKAGGEDYLTAARVTLARAC